MQAYAVLCPGQGSQSPEMFDLVGADPQGRRLLDDAGDAVGCDLVAQARDGRHIFANAFAQPAMVALARSTWSLLAPELPPPALFAGYSVGEVSAWSCAGAWDARTSTRVAAERARLMDAHSPAGFGMLATRGLPLQRLEDCAQGLHLAIVNDIDHAIFAGDDAALARAEARLASHGAWSRRLDVHVPSHTPLLQAAARELRDYLDATPLGVTVAPVLRGVDGRSCERSADAPHALERAVCEPVRWDLCMRALVESGVRLAIELGPGRSLANLCSQAHPELTVRAVADFRSIGGVLDWMQRRLAA